jgi:hypothetical protein
MKKLSIIIIFISIFYGCSNNSSNNIKLDKNIVYNFILDTESIENDTSKNPIESFQKNAVRLANETVTFDQSNIKQVLIKARDYHCCVVVTSNHTIVKIDDLDLCQQSGSWKSCMPKCSGYIKKDKLIFKNDYMNNVIGTPDDQQRIAYFFNFKQLSHDNDVSKDINIDYYNTYKEDSLDILIWISFNNEGATHVMYKGMDTPMNLVLKHKSENLNANGPYPVFADIYYEIFEGQINGEYSLTKSGNWYYANYTRARDSAIFNFTIDHNFLFTNDPPFPSDYSVMLLPEKSLFQKKLEEDLKIRRTDK